MATNCANCDMHAPCCETAGVDVHQFHAERMQLLREAVNEKALAAIMRECENGGNIGRIAVIVRIVENANS